MTVRLGIDLGGTAVKIALVNEKKKIIRAAKVRSSGNPRPQQLVKEIAQEAKQLFQGKKPQSIGVGVAGDIDFKNGIIRVSPNLGWKNVPLGHLLKKAFKKPVIVDNDANVAAWGIYRTQVPKSVKNLIVFTLGTGVGGGIIINGHLHRGATGSAGEVGHLTMIEGGRRCNCGNRGCLETYAGGFYMTREVKRALRYGQKSHLQKLFKKSPSLINPHEIEKAALSGDSFAKSMYHEMGHFLGWAIGNLIYVLNPQMIILTGGVAQAKGLILNPLRDVLKSRAFKVPIGAVKIQVAQKASHAGVIGASLLTE